MTPILSLSGVSKSFPGVRALTRCQPVASSPARVTALIGENGAGKSTIVKILTGIYQPGRAARSASAATPVRFALAARRLGGGHRRDPPGNGDVRRAERRREHLHGAHADRSARLVDWAEMRARTRSAARSASRRTPADYAAEAPVGGAEAPGRDRPRAVARGAGRHHGRADGGAVAPTRSTTSSASSRSSRPRAGRSSSSPTSSTRSSASPTLRLPARRREGRRGADRRGRPSRSWCA